MNASIWWFAFGYFACYVPYSALTKAVSSGMVGEGPVAGFRLLPYSVLVSAIGMVIFITAMGWWKYAPTRRFGRVAVPWPRPLLVLSGLCTGTVIITTTLAYTFSGVSIVFIMLLMRGGVLVLAPIVDALTGRPTRWYSWGGLALSMGALVVAFAEQGGYAITLICAVDVIFYLIAYFGRFRLMTGLAKTDDQSVTLSYFVQEQMIASPALFVVLAILAFGFGGGEAGLLADLRAGFVEVPSLSVFWMVLLIGALSQGTGIFGSLIFLDRRENTFCVPVNRSSSILAGVCASYALYWFAGASPPSTHKLVGAAMIIGAILFLTIPPMLEKRRAALAQGEAA